jgi:uncharacterized protein YjiS (DUF1127 family)
MGKRSFEGMVYRNGGGAVQRWLLAVPTVLRQRWRRSALSRGLSGFSARELRDLGLCRSDIGAVADGSFFSDATRRQRPGRRDWRNA